MTEIEKTEIRKIFLEELKVILISSVEQIDSRVLLDPADSASRRTVAHLVEAVNNRLDELDEIDEK